MRNTVLRDIHDLSICANTARRPQTATMSAHMSTRKTHDERPLMGSTGLPSVREIGSTQCRCLLPLRDLAQRNDSSGNSHAPRHKAFGDPKTLGSSGRREAASSSTAGGSPEGSGCYSREHGVCIEVMLLISGVCKRNCRGVVWWRRG